MRKIIGLILLLTGVSMIFFGFYTKYKGESENASIIENIEWDNGLDNTGSEVFDSGEDNFKEPFNKKVIAIISIPKIKVKYPVVKGISEATLKKSLGHFEETALPGETGNFCVAGHRNSSYAKYFNRLDEVVVGDEIYVETKDGKFTYEVNNVFKVHESETDILEQGNDKRITLVTCVNGFKPKHRIVVQGKLAS